MHVQTRGRSRGVPIEGGERKKKASVRLQLKEEKDVDGGPTHVTSLQDGGDEIVRLRGPPVMAAIGQKDTMEHVMEAWLGRGP